MKNMEDLDSALNLFRLYCFNRQCAGSIYNRATEIKAPFDGENIVATHTCPHCDQPLLSSIDIGINKLLAEKGCRIIRKSIL
jgi:hypothetical protein